jgi:hypothetical protein
MKTFVYSTVIAASLGFATAALAQGNPPPHRGGPNGGHPHGPDPLVVALDVNHDHAISAEEIANAPASLLALDKNGDGKLTFDELCPPRPADAPPPPAGAPAPRPMSPVFRALDTNGDGELSAAEIAAAGSALLALDTNHDGTLTPDEFRPARPAGAPQDAPPPPPAE